MWCYTDHRLDPANISTYNKSKDLSIIIWATIWKHHRSNIVFITRDPESPKDGYSANLYLQVLEDQVLTIYKLGWRWQQDNASIHTVNKVFKYFEDLGVIVLIWPADSPNLNCIENVWSMLKDYINKHYPHL